jgi:hypothetical protein
MVNCARSVMSTTLPLPLKLAVPPTVAVLRLEDDREFALTSYTRPPDRTIVVTLPRGLSPSSLSNFTLNPKLCVTPGALGNAELVSARVPPPAAKHLIGLATVTSATSSALLRA